MSTTTAIALVAMVLAGIFAAIAVTVTVRSFLADARDDRARRAAEDAGEVTE